MERTVWRFIEERQCELRNRRVLVAVSGGPDSVALLHLFTLWRERWDITLHAITINHQLRKEAETDVAHVAMLCKQWEIPLHIERVDVKRYKEKHRVSTQVAARHARYAAFAKVMRTERCHYLALGHHGDDQIETLVMALIQSTTLPSLKGIPFSRPFADGY